MCLCYNGDDEPATGWALMYHVYWGTGWPWPWHVKVKEPPTAVAASSRPTVRLGAAVTIAVLKTDWIKLDPQGWVSSWTNPLNPRPCHAGWPQGKATQGKHKVSITTSYVQTRPLWPTGQHQLTSDPKSPVSMNEYMSYLQQCDITNVESMSTLLIIASSPHWSISSPSMDLHHSNPYRWLKWWKTVIIHVQQCFANTCFIYLS